MSAVLQRAKTTFAIEIEGLQDMMERLDHAFEDAVELLYGCQGKVIITGMGKSGLIGRKIAATLTSTGTPSIFLHPAESIHGDMGVIGPNDTVMAISFSGETAELVPILGHVQAAGVPLIGVTGNANSALARHASVFLNIAVQKEACPLGLSPTTSSTVTLALGDALAMCLLEKRNFKSENFAVFHPGGSLGKKLTICVKDVMVTSQLPFVVDTMLMRDALEELSEKNLGILVVVDKSGRLQGVFTVGDLMRLVKQQFNFLDNKISQYMVPHPKIISRNDLAAKALHIMETHSITCLIVADSDNIPVGIIQIYHILRAGVY
ncbi:MAG: KpsF/GutQ family sugar-phosphate isomerase [SAR324 cluster bacterium]|nr:KpsF/GutQ family sugar-phosphate isomerase [SAR324 cluster bacterium]